MIEMLELDNHWHYCLKNDRIVSLVLLYWSDFINCVSTLTNPMLFVINNFFHIGQLSLLAYSWCVGAERGEGQMTQGTQSWTRALQPASLYRYVFCQLLSCCQRAQISSDTPAGSPTVNSSYHWVCDSVFGCVQETLGIPGEVVTRVCIQMESNYPTYLAPCPRHSSPEPNMSICSQNTCRLVSVFFIVPFVPVVKRAFLWHLCASACCLLSMAMP